MMPWSSMYAYLEGYFNYGSLAHRWIIIGIILAFAFGIIWLLAHWPPLFKKLPLWGVLIVGGFLTMLAVTFIEIPLQYYINDGLSKAINPQTLNNWLWISGLPSLAVTGLVRAGALMVPLVFWWWRSGKTLDPKLGLAIGAIAGAGFAILESTWAHSTIFTAGWTWKAVEQSGFSGILPFWDRFWSVAIYVGVSALVGYGLAKGNGWQFYLLGALLYVVARYIAIPYTKGALSFEQVEFYTAAISALITLAALYLRYRRDDAEEPDYDDEEAEV